MRSSVLEKDIVYMFVDETSAFAQNSGGFHHMLSQYITYLRHAQGEGY